MQSPALADRGAPNLDSVLRFFARHEQRVLYVLVAVAFCTRLALALGSPTPFGYIYDFYPEAVRYVYEHHALPPPSACWICAHPPLFWILGAPFYAAGMLLSHGDRSAALRMLCMLPLLCDAMIAFYTYRLLRLFRQRGLFLLLGMALCLFFPCLAISSHGPESDILLAALMVAGLFHLCRLHLAGERAHLRDAAWLGVFCGLSALTKYSGLLLLIAAGAVVLARWLRGPARSQALRQGALICSLTLAIAGTQYVYNAVTRKEVFVANGSAHDGFAVLNLSTRMRALRHYDFSSLQLGAVVDLFKPDHAKGELNDQPVYSSVWSALHAMAWTDMSFFSVPTRHGDPIKPYPAKHVSIALVRSMLYLGLVPSALAALGFALTLRRRSIWPLAFFGLSSFAMYVWWFLAQDSWALKTKYLLFLLPAYVLFALMGLRRLLASEHAIGRVAAGTTLTLLGALFASSVMYLVNFGLG
jgi:hypothetical protein